MEEVRPALFVEATAEAAATRAAALVVRALDQAPSRPTTLTLAGGSTPQPLYRLLTAQKQIWSEVAVLFGDERVVPPGDPSLNAAMVQTVLLDRVRPHAVHRIEVERGAMAAAAHYSALVAPLPLNLVILGMGADGHTASLFPNGPEDGSPAIVTESPTPPPTRVSLSRSTLGRADSILVLVTGSGKASRLAEVWPQLFGSAEKATAPVARVRPRRRWWWVLDAAAAADLPDGAIPPAGDDA